MQCTNACRSFCHSSQEWERDVDVARLMLPEKVHEQDDADAEWFTYTIVISTFLETNDTMRKIFKRRNDLKPPEVACIPAHALSISSVWPSLIEKKIAKTMPAEIKLAWRLVDYTRESENLETTVKHRRVSIPLTTGP